MVLIRNAKVVPGLKGWLLITFDNDKRKLVNINPLMQGVLKKLQDDTFFATVFVDKELQTVTWPGELDLDPDNLYQQGIDLELLQNLIQTAEQKNEFAAFLDREMAN